MRLLVWCPAVNLGGGVRLLARLAAAVAAHPQVTQVTLALPEYGVPPDLVLALEQHPELIRVSIPAPALDAWLRRFESLAPLAPLARYMERRLLAGKRLQLWQDMLQHMALQADVVYVFWPHLLPFIPTTTPLVCTFQDTTLLDFPEILGGSATSRERERTREWLTHVEQIVVSSEAVRRQLTERYGSLLRPMQTIHHNIMPLPSQSAAHEWQPPSPFPYLIYPANLNVHKNHALLFEAWSRLEQWQHPLVLTGESTQLLADAASLEAADYWQYARLIGLVDRLHLERGTQLIALGYMSDADLTQLIRHAYALVMPSLSEGGGSYPVEEALNLGVPVLCADIPVMREHLASRSASILWFDPSSVDSLIHALHELQAHHDVYRASALAGMSDPRPTWNDIAAQYVAVFQEAISSSPSSDPR